MAKLSIIAAIAVSACVPGLAHGGEQTPVLSGKYVFSETASCPSAPTPVTLSSGVINFDPSTGLARGSIFYALGKIEHDYVNWDFSVPGGKYLVLEGVKYHAEYGDIENGIAKYVSLLGVFAGPPSCSYQGTLVLK